MPITTNWVQFQSFAKQSSILCMKKYFAPISPLSTHNGKSWLTWSDWVWIPALMSWVRFRLCQNCLSLFCVEKNLFIPVLLCPHETASPGRIFLEAIGFECWCWWNISSETWSSEFWSPRRFEYDQIQTTMSPGRIFDARDLLRLFQCGRKKIECQSDFSINSLGTLMFTSSC